jgi:sugar porter (SP) family MFS transporter
MTDTEMNGDVPSEASSDENTTDSEADGVTEGAGGFVLATVLFATVGAVLFGFDQGNWAGAVQQEGFIKAFCGEGPECADPEDYPAWYAEFLGWGSSFVQLGAFFGALILAPPITGKGRREALFTGCIITIVGVIPMCLVTDKKLFLLTRFVTGIGVGIVTYALPMFISEIAPAHIRGVLGGLFQLVMVIGMVAASLLNIFFHQYWISFSLPLYPAVILAAGIFCLPTSPRYAVLKWTRKGDIQKGKDIARAALVRLRGSEEAADAELREIVQSLAEEEEEAPWSTLFKDRSILRRVLIANALQWMQQLTGINALLSYGVSMLKTLPDSPLDPFVAQTVINGCNIVGTVIMLIVIDMYGRRPLMLIGGAGMGIFMTIAAIIDFMIEDNLGGSGKGSMLLVCLCGYILFFGIGWGGTAWVYPSEIFPMDVKEKAMSTSVGSQWLANFVIALVVPMQVKMMKAWGTFAFYSVCLVVIFFSVYFAVPETKGVALENMDDIFGPRALARKSSKKGTA